MQLLLATALFMLQLLSLYTTPVQDSYLWWGDESWLMIEFRTQIMEGVFRHPYALGSNLQHGSGLLFGNMWIPALLYGLPAALFKGGTDIILVGRSVTALLSATLLIALFEVTRRLTGDRVLSLFSVLLLLSSRSFLLTGHSARYDILTSLSILLGLSLLLRINTKAGTKQERLKRQVSSTAVLAGALATGSVLITIHVALAIWIATFVCVLRSEKSRTISIVASYLAGSGAVALLLIGVAMLQGHATLLGGGRSNAFLLNLSDIPALRLFSRSVQSANAIQKWKTLSSLALGYAVAIITGVGLTMIALVRRQAQIGLEWRHVVAAMIVVCWFEFESAAPTSYLIHVLPVLSVEIALIAWRLLPVVGRPWIILSAAAALGIFGLTDAWNVRTIGRNISKANDHAVTDALGQVVHGSAEPRPIVLASNPSIHCILLDTSVQLMTTHLVEFPQDGTSHGELSPLEYAIKKAHVRYILLYQSGLKPDYMREIGPLSIAAKHLGLMVWQQAGVFTDVGRSYFESCNNAPDTLQLYHLYD